MKESELRKRATCARCGKRFGASGMPIFWTLKIERHGLNVDAVKRQDGLAAVLGGNHALANVMGPDDDMTTPLIDPVTVTICEPCSLLEVVVAQLAERGGN